TLHGLFSGGHAVCAVRIGETSTEVTEIWPELQALIADIRTNEPREQERDYYLIFIVDRIAEGSLAAMQRMLDDTRVCRKMCLELRDRTLGDTLRDDLPFFSTPATEPLVPEPVIEAPTLSGIPLQVQRDLELKSADRILESIIAGIYGVLR